MLWQSVADTRTGDRSSSVTDGQEKDAAGDQSDVEDAEQRRCRASESANQCQETTMLPRANYVHKDRSVPGLSVM